MGARSRSRGGLPDAAQDEPTLLLALLHGILVLAGHLRNLLGDVGVDFNDRDEAVAVQVSPAK